MYKYYILRTLILVFGPKPRRLSVSSNLVKLIPLIKNKKKHGGKEEFKG